MENISSIRDLVNLWPTRSELANDLKSLRPDIKVSTDQVHKWAENKTIPPKYHHYLLVAAHRRGFSVTADLLVRLHMPAEDAA